jgi:hypothetical protein
VKRILCLLVILTGTLSGCAIDLNRQDKFLAAMPRSILIVPVVNNSMDINAADYLLATITIPLAERGYYVFPVNLVKRVLEDNGLADSSVVHSAPTQKLANLFGADSVLYITIERWNTKYMPKYATVEIDYLIRDGKTGDSIWHDRKTIEFDASGDELAHLIDDLFGKVIPSATIIEVRRVNDFTFSNAIAPGPYAPNRKDPGL